jgi:hypothetical protein
MALEVQQRLAAGQGILVALDGFNKYSQLAWCLEKQERQRQVGVAAEAAVLDSLPVLSILPPLALAAPPPTPALPPTPAHCLPQAEMPARAAEPAAPALASAAAVAVPAATSSSSSESEGGVSSGLGRQPSRASAVLQQVNATQATLQQKKKPYQHIAGYTGDNVLCIHRPGSFS